ncbi:hypothetical protein [Borreliella afzelii]|uniref:Uncharacterized protein n=1 Tax=Borreliella afzelii (strain PKo) TaxID=390236 RepID=Q0SN52_BORAP|nr:hypothetical protein [Borreliella afzelii]ABH01726.1 hypothetical protein BAPKO_0479 [Borreliella afzelii PKo]AJY72439.1 hypothetical protein BAFK78_454 [Borreliella afzelii K78]EEC20994.1 conserved hypothetical protein [Borreliella afzelii ACA-1]AEL69681.1 conserved hypothetical protein [Borreliella afzelii PKo]AIK18754.1 hypothetical protein P612_02315 [Borreliella afzelii Tom3107]
MKQKLSWIVLFCFLSCRSESRLAEIVLIEFLDSIKNFQSSPEIFFDHLNIPSDDDLRAKIFGLKSQAKDDFIFYPLFFNNLRYEIVDKKNISKGFEFKVIIKNINFQNGIEKFFAKLNKIEGRSSKIKNLEKKERKKIFDNLINKVIGELSNCDYTEVVHFFKVVKNSSKGYKIELLGDVSNIQVRNKLINDLFLVLSPGISNSVYILKNIN